MNAFGSDVKPRPVKDMDLLKSIVNDDGESAKPNSISSTSSSSLSSSSASSSGVSYESSVSENTKNMATPADSTPAGVLSVEIHRNQQEQSETCDIDDDFYGTGVQKATKDPPVNGHANEEKADASHSDEEKKRRTSNGTSTFKFTLDLEKVDSDKPNTDDEDANKRKRVRGKKRATAKPKKSASLTTKNTRSPRAENKNDEFRISPWDYDDSGNNPSTVVKTKPVRRAKPPAARPQVDYQKLEEDRQRMLERKYEELRELLAREPGSSNQDVDPELLQQSKQILRRYKLAQNGNIPGGAIVAPPYGKPPAGRRRRRMYGSPGDTAAHHLQADLGDCSPKSDTVYIDLTQKEVSMRHVTFANGHMQDPAIIVKRDIENCGDLKRGTTTVTTASTRRGRAGRPRSGRNRVARRRISVASSDGSASPRRHKQSPSSDKSPSSSSSPSPGRNTYTSESSNNESASRSRSRSKEKTFEASDHRLKNSQNPKIISWLKRKNKILRKQKAQERKKERAKRKEEEEKLKEQATRHAESEQKVRKWMEEKSTEARLLQKRERLENSRKLKFDDTIVITQTVDLKDGTQNDNPEDQCNGMSEHTDECETRHEINNNCENNGDKKDQAKTITVKVNMKGEETVKCTCGFVEIIKMREEEERHKRMAASKSKSGLRRVSHPDYSIRRRPRSAKRASLSPIRSKKGKVTPAKTNRSRSESNQDNDKQRMSYDEWLQVKRKQDIRTQREEHGKQMKQMSKSDPELERVISNVARRRIEQIRTGKNTIDTGITSVDQEANAYPDGETQDGGHDDDGDDGPKPAKYSWKLDADSQPQRPSTAKITPHSPARPVSGRKRPASAPRGRPTSSRQYFRAPVPPRPSKSPAPGSTTTESTEGVIMPTSPRRRAKSPKPDVVTAAYKKVQNQQASWDEFSDYVWDKINEDEGAEMEKDAEKENKESDEPKVENTGADTDETETKDEVANEAEQTDEQEAPSSETTPQDQLENTENDQINEEAEMEEDAEQEANESDEPKVGPETKYVMATEAEQIEQNEQGAESARSGETNDSSSAPDGDTALENEQEKTTDETPDNQESTEGDECDTGDAVDKPPCEGDSDGQQVNTSSPQDQDEDEVDEDKNNGSLHQAPEIVIDGATEDSVESDDSTNDQPESSNSDADDEQETTENNGEVDEGTVSHTKEDEHPKQADAEREDPEESHTPCILEITEDVKDKESKHDKHVTFLTSNGD